MRLASLALIGAIGFGFSVPANAAPNIQQSAQTSPSLLEVRCEGYNCGYYGSEGRHRYDHYDRYDRRSGGWGGYGHNDRRGGNWGSNGGGYGGNKGSSWQQQGGGYGGNNSGNKGGQPWQNKGQPQSQGGYGGNNGTGTATTKPAWEH